MLSLPTAAAPRRPLPLLLVAAGLLLAGCGDNKFGDSLVTPDPAGQPPAEVIADTVAPSDSRIVLPLPEATIAVGDPLTVRVSAADNTALDSVVVVGVARDGTPRYESASRSYDAADVRSDTVSLVLTPRGNEPADTVFLVATTYDRRGNFSSDTIAISLALIRGAVISLENQTDRLVDLTSDGKRVFASNFTRGRVEVLEVGSGARSTFRVGAEPWGLALSPDSATLLIANSGGTNISRVNLNAAALAEDEAQRIYTPNVRLFSVPFSQDSVQMGGGKVSVKVPGSVTEHDYSDRPQFIAQTRGGDIFYSTKPTGSAPDGTLRRRRTDGEIELFVDYADGFVSKTLVILNARDAGLVEGDPNQLGVTSKEGVYVQGVIDTVQARLAALGSETRFVYGLNVESIGLQDTTFVAVSGDHRTVAFGEGAANPGRIMLYQEGAGGLVRSGETRDLVGNSSERVIGLALNSDGTLGAARGQEAYFFTPDLRLQGVGKTGDPTGGIVIHPSHAGYPSTSVATRLSFVSGRDDNGSPYIDVFDTFSFFRRQRVFVRRPVTGPIVAVQPPAGSAAALRLYAIAGSAILQVDLSADDLR